MKDCARPLWLEKDLWALSPQAPFKTHRRNWKMCGRLAKNKTIFLSSWKDDILERHDFHSSPVWHCSLHVRRNKTGSELICFIFIGLYGYLICIFPSAWLDKKNKQVPRSFVYIATNVGWNLLPWKHLDIDGVPSAQRQTLQKKKRSGLK